MLGSRHLFSSKQYYLLRIFIQSNYFSKQHKSLHFDSIRLLQRTTSKSYPHVQIRFYSEEEDNYFKGPPKQKRENFIKRFLDNVRKGFKSKEFQADLRGLEEETAKMKESKVILTMKQRLETTKKFADESMKSGAKFVGEKADIVKSASSEV